MGRRFNLRRRPEETLKQPVATVAELRLTPVGDVDDKSLIFCEETEKLYAYDLESVAVDDGSTVIQPAAGAGAWLSVTETAPVGSVAHNSTTGLQGGTSGEYFHLTAAELAKLAGIEDGATADQSGSELVALIDIELGGTTWQGGGGSSTVDVVSNIDQDRILGRVSAGSGDSEELTAAQVRTLLNVEDGSTADQTGPEIVSLLNVALGGTDWQVGTNTVDVVSNVAQDVIVGRVSSGNGDSEELTPVQVRTLINVEDGAAADQTGPEIISLLDASLGGSDWQIGTNTVDVVSNVDTSRILGRVTAGNGDSEELTAAQVRTLINVEDGAAADQTGAEIVTIIDTELGNSDWQTQGSNRPFNQVRDQWLVARYALPGNNGNWQLNYDDVINEWTLDRDPGAVIPGVALFDFTIPGGLAADNMLIRPSSIRLQYQVGGAAMTDVTVTVMSIATPTIAGADGQPVVTILPVTYEAGFTTPTERGAIGNRSLVATIDTPPDLDAVQGLRIRVDISPDGQGSGTFALWGAGIRYDERLS